MHSLRGHHPASGRVTGIPQYRRPHHVSSSECAWHTPPTDVWPLRVPLICAACTLAAATACALCTHATSPLQQSGPAASLGTTHPQCSRRWGRRGRSLEHWGQRRKGICRNPRLAALWGVGLGAAEGDEALTSPVSPRLAARRLPLWRFAAPEMCPLTPLAAPSHAAARHRVRCWCHRRHIRAIRPRAQSVAVGRRGPC